MTVQAAKPKVESPIPLEQDEPKVVVLQNILLVALGGALGSGARYTVGHFTRIWLHPSPLLGTLTVNLLGCFLLGLLTAHQALDKDSGAKLLLTTGAMGGFTTFSTFSLDTIKAIQEDQIPLALGYLLLSLLGGLLGAFLGLYVGKNL